MRRVFWILIGIVLAGCATYQPKPLDLAQLVERFGTRSLINPALHAYLEQQLGRPVSPWPLARWNREMFTLAAGFYSPALAAARAQQQAAQAGITSAGARPNPTLQFPFEYTLNHQGEGRPITTGPALDWPFEPGGKRAARIDQAAALAEAARLNTLNDAWKIRSQVRAALLEIFADTRRMVLLADKAALQKSAVEMLERRLAAGAAAMPDVRRAQLLLAQTRSELAAAQGALRDARAQLATTVGIPVTALDAVDVDFTEFEYAAVAPSPAEARRAAILHRADLRSALAEYDASQAALHLEIARQYPDIHLGVGYTYDTGANKISFGLAGLTLPLFDTNRGAIAQAEAGRTERAARVEALQAAILNDLDNSLARYRENISAVERTTRQAATAARQRDSEQASFAVGLADRLELTQARADYQTVALDYLNTVVALQKAVGQLEDTMQQLMPVGTASLLHSLRESAP